MVVAQLVEWSLPIPEVRGSNPVIGKNLYWTFYCQLYWKDENKEKEAGKGPFFKAKTLHQSFTAISQHNLRWVRKFYIEGFIPMFLGVNFSVTWLCKKWALNAFCHLYLIGEIWFNLTTFKLRWNLVNLFQRVIIIDFSGEILLVGFPQEGIPYLRSDRNREDVFYRKDRDESE